MRRGVTSRGGPLERRSSTRRSVAGPIPRTGTAAGRPALRRGARPASRPRELLSIARSAMRRGARPTSRPRPKRGRGALSRSSSSSSAIRAGRLPARRAARRSPACGPLSSARRGPLADERGDRDPASPGSSRRRDGTRAPRTRPSLARLSSVANASSRSAIAALSSSCGHDRQSARPEARSLPLRAMVPDLEAVRSQVVPRDGFERVAGVAASGLIRKRHGSAASWRMPSSST